MTAPDVDVTAHDWREAFAFARAQRDGHVRAMLATRGYTSGTPVIIGRSTDPAALTDERPVFRAWRDDDVPGGWTGEVVYG